jgi:hypothetical protein
MCSSKQPTLQSGLPTDEELVVAKWAKHDAYWVWSADLQEKLNSVPVNPFFTGLLMIMVRKHTASSLAGVYAEEIIEIAEIGDVLIIHQ